MLVSQAITYIRTATSHDADDQVSDAQLTSWLQVEQDRVRVRLGAAVPSLYNATASTTLTAGQDTITKPVDFLAMRRLERQYNSLWEPVAIGDGLSTNGYSGVYSWIDVREQGNTFVISPADAAPGTYRLTYITVGATLYTPTALDVPLGLEDVLIERVSARVRERCEEDPSAHLRRADEVWREMLPALKKRYGAHPVSGLRRVRG